MRIVASKRCVCVRIVSIFVFDSEIADATLIDKHIIAKPSNLDQLAATPGV